MVTVVPARTPEQLDDFRTLVREFLNWALQTFHTGKPGLPSVFANLEEELAGLPGKYAEPDGGLYLAHVDEGLAGCIAGFRRDGRSMEVTRLWVRPDCRGHGVGDHLVATLLTGAAKAGYDRAVLRSRQEMAAAHRIYRGAGFSDMDGAAYFPDFKDFEVAMQRNLG